MANKYAGMSTDQIRSSIASSVRSGRTTSSKATITDKKTGKVVYRGSSSGGSSSKKRTVVIGVGKDEATGTNVAVNVGKNLSSSQREQVSQLTSEQGRLQATPTDEGFSFTPYQKTPKPTPAPTYVNQRMTLADSSPFANADRYSQGTLGTSGLVSPQAQETIRFLRTKDNFQPNLSGVGSRETLNRLKATAPPTNELTQEEKPFSWGTRDYSTTQQITPKADRSTGLFQNIFFPTKDKPVNLIDPSITRSTISTDNLIEKQDFFSAYPITKQQSVKQVSGGFLSVDDGSFVAEKPGFLLRASQKSEEFFDQGKGQTFGEIGISLGATAVLAGRGFVQEGVRTAKAFTVDLPQTIIGFENLATGRTKFSDIQLVDPSASTAEKIGAIGFQAGSSVVSGRTILTKVSSWKIVPSKFSKPFDMFTSSKWEASPVQVASEKVFNQDTIQLDLFGRVIGDDDLYRLASPDVIAGKKSPLGLPRSYYEDLLSSTRRHAGKGSNLRLDENIGVQGYSLSESGQYVLTDFRTVGPRTRSFSDPKIRVVDKISGFEDNIPSSKLASALVEKPSLSVVGQTPRRLFAVDPFTFTILETRRQLTSFKPKFIEAKVKFIDDVGFRSQRKKFLSSSNLSNLTIPFVVTSFFKEQRTSLAQSNVLDSSLAQSNVLDSSLAQSNVLDIGIKTINLTSLDTTTSKSSKNDFLPPTSVLPQPVKGNFFRPIASSKKIIIPKLPSPSLSASKRSEASGEYVAYAGNPLGKYQKTFKEKNLKTAVSKAKRYVDNTPAASLAVYQNDMPLPESKRLAVKGQLGKNYRRSVIDQNVFVEEREKRITTGGEKLNLRLDKKLNTKNNIKAVSMGLSLRSLRRMKR